MLKFSVRNDLLNADGRSLQCQSYRLSGQRSLHLLWVLGNRTRCLLKGKSSSSSLLHHTHLLWITFLKQNASDWFISSFNQSASGFWILIGLEVLIIVDM